jgi:hypothetical protein
MVAQVAAAYEQTSRQIKKQCQDKKEKMKNLLTYTMDQIMNGDSSSDEDERNEEAMRMNHFPWLKKGYQNIYDDLICDETDTKTANYPKASETDTLIHLTGGDQHERDLSLAPEKILIVTCNQVGADVILEEFEQLSLPFKIVRMSHSINNEKINSKYALDKLAKIDFSKNKDRDAKTQQEEADKRAKVLAAATVVVAPLTSLLTSNLNKSLLDKFVLNNPDEQFDTVIVDDANLVDEVELIQAALRFGCKRLLLFGNSRLG